MLSSGFVFTIQAKNHSCSSAGRGLHMLNAKVHLFGVPGQFESYPKEAPNSYYQQFYNGDTTPCKFLIRQDHNHVRYILVNNGLVSGSDRGGSFMGICIDVEGNYFKEPRSQILVAMREIYAKLVADRLILSPGRYNNAKFCTDSFQKNQEYLDGLLRNIEKGIESAYGQDVIKLTTNLDKNSAQIASFDSDPKSNAVINENLLRYGGVSIVPSLEKGVLPGNEHPQQASAANSQNKPPFDLPKAADTNSDNAAILQAVLEQINFPADKIKGEVGRILIDKQKYERRQQAAFEKG